MAHALCLQDWVVIGGNASSTSQDDSQIADLLGYQDAAIYVEVSSVTNASVTTALKLQTSPVKDASYFAAQTIATYSFAASPTLGVQPVTLARFPNLARYVRWVVTFTGAGACAITFRIWLNLNQAGW